MAKKNKQVKEQKIEQTGLIGSFECPNCEHDQFMVIGDYPSTDFANVLPDGTRFTKVVRHRVECSQCGKVSLLKRYEFNPADWKE